MSETQAPDNYLVQKVGSTELHDTQTSSSAKFQQKFVLGVATTLLVGIVFRGVTDHVSDLIRVSNQNNVESIEIGGSIKTTDLFEQNYDVKIKFRSNESEK